MIYINNLSINNTLTQLSVDVETNTGANITSVLLWNENTFKDYSKAIDLSFKLEEVNNKEIFIVTSTEINLSDFSGIYFLEFTSNYDDGDDCTNCQNIVIGVVANLNNIKKYLLNSVLELNDCEDCLKQKDFENIIAIDLTTNGLSTALSIGFYEEAIFLYKKLKRLIGPKLDCSSCRSLKTPQYINGLNFAILDNSIILI